MSLDRALQLCTATLALMGALFLALGHDSRLIPLLLASAAIASFWLTDVFAVLRLHRLLANGIAILAVIWSLRYFFQLAPTSQLLAIANMLVYLQIVLLFQKKSARVYWQLLVLSLLQVVVAAALSRGPQFGLLLSLYIFIALASLILLCTYRDLGRDSFEEGTRPSRAPSHRRRYDGIGASLLAPPEVAPLSTLTDSGGLGAGLTIRLIIRQVAALAGATFVFTAVFFYSAPRLSENAWLGPRSSGTGRTGLPPEMKLEEGGEIQLSQQVVMRVTLSRAIDRQPVTLANEPYFHAAALTTYVADEKGSRWTTTQLRQRTGLASTATNLVRQEIVLETATVSQLLAMWPVQRIHDTPQELDELYPYRLRFRGQDTPSISRQYRYVYATPAIKNGRQLPAIPHQRRYRMRGLPPSKADPRTDEEVLEAELNDLKVVDLQRFPRLAALAAETLKSEGLEQSGPFERALALERHFRLPEKYEYSLNLNFARDTALDPIEDFVANHKTGHCEYFASALALMLRTQGIPSRVVHGFKGGQFNTLGRYFVVQQRHAHAWVEAWLPPEQVADYDIAGGPSPYGYWYRLDPTPISRARFTSEDESTLSNRLAQAFDYVDLLWRDYVLSLDSIRQQDAFFDPLTFHATSLPAWSEGRNFQRWLRRTSRRFGFDIPNSRDRANQRAFEGTVAVIVIVGLLMLVSGIWLTLFLHRYVTRWIPALSRGNSSASSAPTFYRRLERLLSRLGLRRDSGQTAGELATLASHRLAAGNGYAAAGLPAEVVAAYYRVRFGAEHLDKTEADAIELSLSVLNTSIRRTPKQ